MYVRLTESVKDFGKLIPANEDIYKYINDTNKDYYVSPYFYNHEQKKIFEKTGSVKGMTDVVTDTLFFDIDRDENLEYAAEDTIKLLKRLNDIDINNDAIRVYFSGKKGFHVVVKTDQKFQPTELKKIAKSIAGDLKGFDDVVYNANRILRVPNTKHPSSSLFKVELDPSELESCSIEEILEIAKNNGDLNRNVRTAHINPEIISKKEPKKETVTKSHSNDFDMSRKPKELSPWKYALEQGYFPPGQRNNALTILAATYKGLGYNKTKAYYSLKASAELQADRFGQEKKNKDEIWTVVNSVFNVKWKGGTYAEDNFPVQLVSYLENELGIPRKNEAELDIFQKSNRVFDIYKDFAVNIDKNTIKTGIDALDRNMKITTSMLVGLLGAPSSGKTTVAMEIIKNTSLNQESVAFFSMDMGAPLVFQRLAQKVSGYSGERLERMFKDNSEEEIKKLQYKIDRDFKNVNFSFKTALSVKSIRDSVTRQENVTGKKTRLIVIDYLECITSDISDPTAKISMVAQELKDLANDLQCCVLLLLQPPKRAGDPSQPLLSYSDIKGAATVAQACSVVFSIWREGFSPKNYEQDKFISFAVLKNRMGTLSQTDCGFDGLSGDITDLADNEKRELEEMRQASKIEKVLDI